MNPRSIRNSLISFIGILIVFLTPLDAQTTNWTKVFLRGAYNGVANSYQNQLNHSALHLNFRMGYGYTYSQISVYYHL